MVFRWDYDCDKIVYSISMFKLGRKDIGIVFFNGIIILVVDDFSFFLIKFIFLLE